MANVSLREAINKLPNPGIPNQTWLRMKRVLRAVSRYQPNPFPSVRRLERDTKIPFQTVARLLVRAEALGLISRTPTEGRGSYTYALLCVSNGVSNETEEELRSSPTEKNSDSSSYGPEAKPTRRFKNRYTGDCCVCGFPVQPKAGWLHGKRPVHQECDEGVPVNREHERQRREDLEGPPVAGADPDRSVTISTRPVDPAVALAHHFDGIWTTEALKVYPHWRGEYRGIHTGPAVGYIRSQFIAKGYNTEHVEAYFDAFFDELLDPNTPLEPKPGQTAWQLFTGWWGSVAVADPVVEREHREWIESMKTGPTLPPTVLLPWERDASEG